MFLDVLRSDLCKFTSSWLSDEVDLSVEESLDLIDIAAEATQEILIMLFITIFVLIISFVILMRIIRMN